MVAVDVDVEHARNEAEHLEDAEYDVVDVAEPGCFTLLGVVEAPSPVDRDVGVSVH